MSCGMPAALKLGLQCTPGSSLGTPAPSKVIPIPSCRLPSAALPKAVLSLQPPWINLLQDDRVTLNCQGPHAPGNDSTRWFHDGNPILSQAQPSYRLQVSSNDSGDYRCQTAQSSLSDPVRLDVDSGQWSESRVWGDQREDTC